MAPSFLLSTKVPSSSYPLSAKTSRAVRSPISFAVFASSPPERARTMRLLSNSATASQMALASAGSLAAIL
ncbi:hypothetical protein EVA_17984 [gut metagenome]|uniref:Uncharacterized protein n=1 Tax=gut metagenome TaxID=749906 RepID=J9G2W3_9ZZZZ